MQDRVFLDECFSFTTVEGHTSFTGGASIFLQVQPQIEHQFQLSEVLSAKHAAARFFEDSKPGATPQRSGFDLVCQLAGNKLTHSLNGNTTRPICIKLDNLLPTTEVVLNPQQLHPIQVSLQLYLVGYKAPILLQDPIIRLSFPPLLLLPIPDKNSLASGKLPSPQPHLLDSQNFLLVKAPLPPPTALGRGRLANDTLRPHLLLQAPPAPHSPSILKELVGGSSCFTQGVWLSFIVVLKGKDLHRIQEFV